MSLTPSQQKAVAARGNVLVIAGAGTGKTRTLVERCLDCLINEKPRISLDQILLVTFTEAAAAEMRERIRARFEAQSSTSQQDTHWEEQLALFETAKIGTLHSFCLHLVRQHFYELELDPQLSVLAEEETRLLAEETLDDLLEKCYRGKGTFAEGVQELIQTQGQGSDQPVRNLVLRLHQYTQTLPAPAAWLKEQFELFESPAPLLWREWLLGAIKDWRMNGIETLQALAPAYPVAAKCRAALLQLPSAPSTSEAAAVLSAVVASWEGLDNGERKSLLKPIEDFAKESTFLHSLSVVDGGVDPLQQDWDWVRNPMRILLDLAKQFAAEFAEKKRELAVVDFHDLEQCALRLLWDSAAARPTDIAREWRKQLRFVFVDEYQDINAAQDCIIRALARDDHQANRFLVGDVKQSIYRFRLANPHIFQSYRDEWQEGQRQVIPLVENFRSRKEILTFINSVFEKLMHREFGGVEYDEQARLTSGAQRPGNEASATAPCAVELHLRIKGSLDNEHDENQNDESRMNLSALQENAKEARLLAARLQQLVSSRYSIWDEAGECYRPVEFRDIAILLRSPANKAESYAKEFARLNIPLQVARGGFYSGIEISDLLNLLRVLDNPLQDLPVLAVLRSPFVGLTLDELAEMRLAAPRGYFWSALLRWHETFGASNKSPDGEARPDQVETEEQQDLFSGSRASRRGFFQKVSAFLENFSRWRRLARQVALSECLELILSETHYTDWVLVLERGQQRYENIKRLLMLAQRFDQLQRQGLFRFLRFIEAQESAGAEPETASATAENAIQLMSIHQSKGLEFPVVAVADLGKRFNFSDLSAEIILDEQFGLCPKVKLPRQGARYPSLPHWLAARRQKRELLGEELRLLYVATTRAKDLLVLSGSTSRSSFDRIWKREKTQPSLPLDKARSLLDWVGDWFAENADPNQLEGQNSYLAWRISDDGALASITKSREHSRGSSTPKLELDRDALELLERRFAWQYPFVAAPGLPAKTSVSAVRRFAATAEDYDSLVLNPRPIWISKPTGQVGNAAAEIGNAHHAFLEKVSLDKTGSEAQLRLEAERLRQEGLLTDKELPLLDFSAIAKFWNSEIGIGIREHSSEVRRELPFTFRFPADELAQLLGQPSASSVSGDFVVVQGVADLAVILPDELWLLDFKTDKAEAELAAKRYEMQLRIYARALSDIFRAPVTRAWLHFLAQGKTVPVDVSSVPAASF